MKKFLCLFLILLLSCMTVACEKPCEHTWNEATCTAPKTCLKCGATEGETTAHNFAEATCMMPKTCPNCGATEGAPSTLHTFDGDTCTGCGIVQLTLYNYEKYLDVTPTVGMGNTFLTDTLVSVKGTVTTSGNVHYKYENVVLKVKFFHYDPDTYFDRLIYEAKLILGDTDLGEEPKPYDESICSVQIDLSGSGKAYCLVDLPFNMDGYTIYDSGDIFDRTLCEIVSISGTVKEYQ